LIESYAYTNHDLTPPREPSLGWPKESGRASKEEDISKQHSKTGNRRLILLGRGVNLEQILGEDKDIIFNINERSTYSGNTEQPSPRVEYKRGTITSDEAKKLKEEYLLKPLPPKPKPKNNF